MLMQKLSRNGKRAALARRPTVTVWSDDNVVSVPSWVQDLGSFRRWVNEPQVPEKLRVWFLMGEVWLDMSKEQIFTHVQVKTKYTIVVGGLVERDELGMFLADGLLLTNVAANISGKPDGTFISNDSLVSGRVRLIEGKDDGFVEVEGTPDMVLEILSRSSEYKDKVWLRQAYWEAGIPEYWLVDARQDPVEFDILRHTARGYVASRKQDGWVKSAVLGKSFQLIRQTNALGHPDFVLNMR